MYINEDDVYVDTREGITSVYLRNEEKKLHRNEGKWAMFDEDNEIPEDSDLIGYQSYHWMSKGDNVIIQCFVVEVREEYRGKGVFKILQKYFDRWVDYMIEDYGKENVIVKSNFKNLDLKEYREKWAKEKGIKLIDMNNDGNVHRMINHKVVTVK